MTDDDPSDSVGSPGKNRPAPEIYNEFAAPRPGLRFTDWLRDRMDEPQDDVTVHRLTREFVADELADDVFRQYLVQDYTFVETFVDVLGHVVGITSTMVPRSGLVSFLGVLADDEDDYSLRAFDAPDVPESVYSEPKTMPTTCTFIDLLEHAAGRGGYAEVPAVLVPAEWVYLSWVTAVADADDSSSRFYLSEWVDLHAVDDFASFVKWLQTELDREGAAVSPRRQRRFEQLFRRTVELEAAFFDEAHELGRGSSRPGDD